MNPKGDVQSAVGKKYRISVPVRCSYQCSAPLQPRNCCYRSPRISADVLLHPLPNNCTPRRHFLKASYSQVPEGRQDGAVDGGGGRGGRGPSMWAVETFGGISVSLTPPFGCLSLK